LIWVADETVPDTIVPSGRHISPDCRHLAIVFIAIISHQTAWLKLDVDDLLFVQCHVCLRLIGTLPPQYFATNSSAVSGTASSFLRTGLSTPLGSGAGHSFTP